MSAAVSRCIGSAPRLRQQLHRPGHQSGAEQQRLADGEIGERGRFVRRHGAQTGQVEGQRAHRRGRQRRDRHRRPRADDPLAQVDQAHAGRQRATELVGDGSPVGADLVDQTGQPGGRGVIAEQMGADPVGHPQPAGEERTLGLLDHDQPPADQRPAQLQPGSGARRHGRLAGQLQGQPDRGAAPGHVVVEVAVQPLEPAVQIRQQGDHQQLDVQRSQTGGPGEPPQPQAASRLPRPRRRRPPARPGRRCAGGGRHASFVVSSCSTVSSLTYRPRNGSSGDGSPARRSATSSRTRPSTSWARPRR